MPKIRFGAKIQFRSLRWHTFCFSFWELQIARVLLFDLDTKLWFVSCRSHRFCYSIWEQIRSTIYGQLCRHYVDFNKLTIHSHWWRCWVGWKPGQLVSAEDYFDDSHSTWTPLGKLKVRFGDVGWRSLMTLLSRLKIRSAGVSWRSCRQFKANVGVVSVSPKAPLGKSKIRSVGVGWRLLSALSGRLKIRLVGLAFKKPTIHV